MYIRSLCQEDFGQIERIAPFAAVQLKYNRGVSEDHGVCLIDGDKLAGFGYLTLHQTRKQDELKITYDMFTEPEYEDNRKARELLTDGILESFRCIQKENPGVKVYLNEYAETDELKDIQFLLEKGFIINAVSPVLKYDLNQEIRHYPLPEGIVIERMQFNKDSMDAYLHADQLVGEEMNAETDLWFHTGDSSFGCYVAKFRDEMVGSVSVWNISDERGATENIFVIPGYRRQNIARELIATAFEELKERGMKIATLSVAGRNLPAIRLYLSCGYSLYYNLLELRCE